MHLRMLQGTNSENKLKTHWNVLEKHFISFMKRNTNFANVFLLQNIYIIYNRDI